MQADPACPGVLVEPPGDLAGLEQPAVDLEPLVGLRLDRGQGGVEPLAQHPELQRVEQLVHRLAVPLPDLQVERPDVERDVAVQLGELPVAHHVAEVLPQRVAGLAGHLVDPVDQLVQRPELLDPLRRGLLPHAGDRRQVVARVATQRGEVRVLLGVRLYLAWTSSGVKRVMSLMPRRVIRTVMSVVDQLQRVPVAGDDQHAHVDGSGGGGERGDDVVGLVARHAHHRDRQRRADLADQRDLPPEVGRRLAAVGLVLRVGLVPERRPALVPGDGDVGRRLVPQDVDQHRGEAVDRVGGLPGGGREVLDGQREEGAVGQRVPVEQQQAVAGRLALAGGRVLHRLLRRPAATRPRRCRLRRGGRGRVRRHGRGRVRHHGRGRVGGLDRGVGGGGVDRCRCRRRA